MIEKKQQSEQTGITLESADFTNNPQKYSENKTFDEEPDSNLILKHEIGDAFNDKKPKAVNIILDKIGYTKFHYCLIASCGILYISEGVQIYSVSMLTPTFNSLFDYVSDVWKVTVASALFVGLMFGYFFTGTLTSNFGRKITINNVLIILSGLALFISGFENIYIITTIRFLIGTSLGMIMPQCLNNLSEFLPSENKEIVILSMHIFYRVGIIYFILIFKLISPDAYIHYWRYTFIFSAIPVLLATLLMNVFLKDSPKLQLTRGELEEAIKTVNYLATQNSTAVHSEDLDTMKEEHRSNNENEPKDYVYKKLFSDKYRNVIFLCTLIIVSSSIVNVCNLHSLPIMLTVKDKLEHNPQNDLALKVFFPQIVTIPSILLSAVICKFLGRKNTAIIGFTLCLISSGFSSILKQGLIITSSLINFFILFSICSAKLYVIEVFPTKLRDYALAFCFCFAKMGDALTPLLCNLSLNLYSFGPMIIINIFCSIGFICSICLPFDTLGSHID